MANTVATFEFEKNDRVVGSQWIPWYATKVCLCISGRVPENYQFKIEDFVLILDDGRQIPGTFLPVKQEKKAILGKIKFLFPSSMANVSGQVKFREKIYPSIQIPWVSQSQFVSGLSMDLLTLQGVFKNQVIGCESFSGFGSSGLMASIGIASVHGFQFLEMVSLQLRYSLDGAGGTVDLLPLIPENPAEKLLVSVPFSGLTHQVGNLELDLMADGISIGKKIFKGINQLAFQKLLTVDRSTFVAWRADGTSFFTEEVKSMQQVVRISPGFFLKTTVKGLVGITGVKIYGYLHGSYEPFLVWQGKMAIGESPVFLGCVSMDYSKTHEVKKFEVWAGKIVLGTLSTGTKPASAFTAEGAIANIEDLERTENISVQEVFNKLKKFISPN